MQLSANAADDASYVLTITLIGFAYPSACRDDSTISGSDGAAQHAIRKANSLRTWPTRCIYSVYFYSFSYCIGVLEFISQYGAKWDAKLDG